ncbi:ribosome biogenesis GTPase YqeH [Virgibacillus oceani]
MEETVCQGCGASLQSRDPKELGYIPLASLEKENPLCKRCFRLKHYNEVQEVAVTDDDFLQMISTIRNTKSLVVHLIDIFDVNGTLLRSLPRIVGDNPIILVGNKMDLLPKSTNERKVIHWLRASAKEAGLTVKDVLLISSEKGYGFEPLEEKIETWRNNRDVYIVGATNVGKSTFINRLIKQSTGYSNVVTTSYFPGTTLGFIEIPLDDDTSLIDTPGIVNKEQITHLLSAADLKVTTPRKVIKPRVYQLNSGQTLFFGGLGRIDFIKGEKQSFVCYFSNELEIHRTKLEKADNLYKNHVGELLVPPNKETIAQLPPLVENTFHIKHEKMDIVFPGLGWISIDSPNTTIITHSPKGVTVTRRKALI